MNSSLNELPKFLRPSLKMFLSVDLIGSTKLKHDENALKYNPESEKSFEATSSIWFKALIDFYSGFEVMFAEAWRHAFTDDGIAEPRWPNDKQPNPSLWKINGDELIYVLEIVHPGQIATALYAWRHALLSYRRFLRDTKSRLDLKATAWMAGFPIGNHEVAFWSDLSDATPDLSEHAGQYGQYYRLNEWYEAQENNSKSDYVKDYIGPAVDTGFRLSAYATAHRFPVSMEIAYFLSKIDYDGKPIAEIGLKYHGKENLKGVLGGSPYPIFWIDTSSPDDELVKAENKLLGTQESCSLFDVREYVTLFFNDEKNILFRPFIYNCKDIQYADIPQEYEKKIYQRFQVWKLEKEKLKIQNDLSPPDDHVETKIIDRKQMKALFSDKFKKL
ncbi:hypothetical protein [Robiginitomaculum antarcticum]|uniref:hypothetical protein n=1 Tax=Robiginitomaculum antarcticum TaxID=437507 RepID=UPI001F370B29|nr:hypothetical protein [Robiginitomaculum antarcticum]